MSLFPEASSTSSNSNSNFLIPFFASGGRRSSLVHEHCSSPCGCGHQRPHLINIDVTSILLEGPSTQVVATKQGKKSLKAQRQGVTHTATDEQRRAVKLCVATAANGCRVAAVVIIKDTSVKAPALHKVIRVSLVSICMCLCVCVCACVSV